MAEPLKNCYNQDFFTQLDFALKEIYPQFDGRLFRSKILDDHWEHRELKDRMHHIARTMHHFLHADPERSIPLLVLLADKLKSDGPALSFAYMFIPDYIEQFGLDHLKTSIRAFERITCFTSCEFAVRPFILKYPDVMMKQMLKWATHPHNHVRRLASEGCRPRLPWTMALDFLKKDPLPIIPILEQLKSDPSEFVRRSVANNINDISKDHPSLVIDLLKRWKNKSPHTDWILKHGSRTLLKKGNTEVLALFDLKYSPHFVIHDFKIQTRSVAEGESLKFEFTLENKSLKTAMIRMEYGIYFRLANGNHSRKVFKISEREYPGKSMTKIKRNHSFRAITTRRYYPGTHKISIIVNGEELIPEEFELLP